MSSPTPMRVGWHLVHYSNGDAAVVQWNGSSWNWSDGTSAPTGATITSTAYLGTSIADVKRNEPMWEGALTGLDSAVKSNIMSELQDGPLGQEGKSVVISGGIGRGDGNPNTPGSRDATPQATDPSNSTAVSAGVSLPSVSGVLGFLTDPTTWIRLAELVGGIALILMGLKSLTGSTTTPVTVATTAAKRAAEVATA